jgi:protein-S-isoprenylcysteine O-methyltransferase Ste14
MKYIRKTIALSIGFFAVGMFLVYLPYTIGTSGPPILQKSDNIFRYSAIFPVLLGIFISGKCMWDFTFKGQGTPVPIDLPQKLVVIGFYRWVRNPMYVGVFCILLGYLMWFQSMGLLLYFGGIVLAVHLLVVCYEEPTLEQRFGEEYRTYCQSVPRWFPRLLPRKSAEQEEE